MNSKIPKQKISINNIHLDRYDKFYLINEIVDRFRWVSVVESEKDWGIKIARLKGQPIDFPLAPIEVEWIPETLNRRICDVPNFRSNLKCVSRCAASKLAKLFEKNGEWLELSGLDYNAFYCLNIVDTMAEEPTKKLLNRSDFWSFHDPRFSPVLRRRLLPEADVFRIPQSISKIFVSSGFKDAFQKAHFTGLNFIPVPII